MVRLSRWLRVLAVVATAFCIGVASISSPQDNLSVARDTGPTVGDCSAAVVGLSPSENGTGLQGCSSPSETLVKCGVALVRRAFSPEPLMELLDVFRALPESKLHLLRHGRVREKRLQTHLPFETPFDGLELLGVAHVLEAPLRAALGDRFVLDLVTVVEVPPGSMAQDPHRDSPYEGSVAVHIPLHELDEAAAPLSLCVGTHLQDPQETSELMRDALLWRPRNETSQAAKRRLFCGGRQRTLVIEGSLSPSVLARIKVRDSRLGVAISRLGDADETAALPLELRLGDEITHIAGRRLRNDEDWHDAVSSEMTENDDPVSVRVERPLSPVSMWPPPLLGVGAPLAVGDALLYDSRTFHWGMAHSVEDGPKNTTRYVLYANFKDAPSRVGVHPDQPETPEETRLARSAFQSYLLRLRGHQEQDDIVASEL